MSQQPKKQRHELMKEFVDNLYKWCPVLLIVLMAFIGTSCAYVKLRGPRNATYVYQYKEIADPEQIIRIGYSDNLYLPSDTIDATYVVVAVKRKSELVWLK